MLVKMIKTLKNKKGFTLVEIIIVIAILAILAAIAVPRLGGYTNSARMAADNSLLESVRKAAIMVEANGVVALANNDAISFTNTAIATSGNAALLTAVVALVDGDTQLDFYATGSVTYTLATHTWTIVHP